MLEFFKQIIENLFVRLIIRFSATFDNQMGCSILGCRLFFKLFTFIFLLLINCFIILAENGWSQKEQGQALYFIQLLCFCFKQPKEISCLPSLDSLATRSRMRFFNLKIVYKIFFRIIHVPVVSSCMIHVLGVWMRFINFHSPSNFLT